LKDSYEELSRKIFGGLRWSPESVAFNSGRSTRSHLGDADYEAAQIEFFNRIDPKATYVPLESGRSD